jgi:hypothetical protein
MPWFLVKYEYVLEDGTVYNWRDWFEGVDFIDAAEKACKDRQWDRHQRVEFEGPEQVVSAKFSAKRYNVRPKEIVAFDITRDGRENIQYAPGGRTRRVSADSEPDWRDVQESGYGFER